MIKNKSNKLLDVALLICLISYSLIVFTLSLYIHEGSHALQSADIEKTNVSFCTSPFMTCILNGSRHFGYYYFECDKEKYRHELVMLEDNYELEAYAAQLCFIIILTGFGYFFIFKLFRKIKEKLQ